MKLNDDIHIPSKHKKQNWKDKENNSHAVLSYKYHNRIHIVIKHKWWIYSIINEANDIFLFVYARR